MPPKSLLGQNKYSVSGHRSASKWHQIHTNNNKKKPKNADGRVWGDARGDQKPDTFLLPYLSCFWQWPIHVVVIYSIQQKF